MRTKDSEISGKSEDIAERAQQTTNKQVSTKVDRVKNKVSATVDKLQE